MDMLKKTRFPVSASFIDGKSVPLADNQILHPNYYPGNNEIIGESAYASNDDVVKAVASAEQAFHQWSSWPLNSRSDVLLNAAQLLRANVDKLAEMEVWDTGKPLSEALSVDVYSAADCLEYFAKIALAYEDNVIPHTQALIYTRREPLGVCAGIGAWNYPLQIACWKAAPALVMGNAMVYKPSELTPMTTLALAQLFIDAGLPKGVFNVLVGDARVAETLLSTHPVAKISFTGSVATGKKILRQAAERLIPTTLELGGKSPLIIFEDANLDQAVIGSMLANFYTQGEVCTNGTRVFVARKRYEAFLEKLTERVKKLVIGDPFEKRTQVGALISKAHMQIVLDYISQGKSAGASLIYGGRAMTDGELASGNFIEPAIFTDCRDDMSIVADEIFGPVMCVLPFDEESEVIQRANNTSHGLAAGLFTENLKRAHRVARQLQAGVCWVNNYNITPVAMPFGGRKSSGFGRENGVAALSHYSQLKSVYVELEEIEHSYS
jgi:betaine-aldehyde dehydrogenase